MIDNFGYFGLGLINSLHCLGMCSPIVLAYSSHFGVSEVPISPKVATATHLFYNIGRVLTYSLIGGFSGVAGQSIDYSLIRIGIGQSHVYVSLCSGVIVFMFGLMQLGILKRWTFLSENFFFKSNIFQKAIGIFISSTSLSSKLIMGILLGFLPCILTYSMFITAISSGGFIDGFTMLLFFGLGTIPMLFLTGIFSGSLTRGLRGYGNSVSGVAMLLLGIFMIGTVFFQIQH